MAGPGSVVLFLFSTIPETHKKTRRFMSLPVYMNTASVSTATFPVPLRPPAPFDRLVCKSERSVRLGAQTSADELLRSADCFRGRSSVYFTLKQSVITA